MTPIEGRKSSKIEDRTKFPTDPHGPASTLPDSLLQLALQQIAERVRTGGGMPGVDPSSAIGGYAKMMSHGTLSPDTMAALRLAVTPQEGRRNPTSQAMDDLRALGSRDMGSDVRNGYAAALLGKLINQPWSMTPTDESYITRMKAMLGQDPMTNDHLRRMAASRGQSQPRVQWGLENSPFSWLDFGREAQLWK